MRIPKNGPVSILLIALGVIAMSYEAKEYAGLYRIVGELQQRFLGFNITLFSTVASAIYLIPGALLAPDWNARRDAFEASFDTAEELGIFRQRRWARRLIRYWIPVAALATGAMFLYERSIVTPPPPAPVTIDLASIGTAKPPLGVPVFLVGRPVYSAIVAIQERGYNVFKDEITIPVTAADDPGPFRYFIYQTDQNSGSALSDLQEAGRVKGTLSENNLDGRARAALDRAGTPVADPHYVLRPWQEDTRGPFDRTWIFGVAAAILILLWLNCLRLIRKYRRDLVEMSA